MDKMKLILLTIACLLAGFPAIGFKKKEVNNGLNSLTYIFFWLLLVCNLHFHFIYFPSSSAILLIAIHATLPVL